VRCGAVRVLAKSRMCIAEVVSKEYSTSFVYAVSLLLLGDLLDP